MKNSADWLAWGMQLVFGAVVGLVIGLGVISRRYGGRWLESEHVPMFVGGASLLFAALASYYGDRLWLGSAYRVIPPDEMPHSNASRRASWILGVIAVAMMAVAICRNYGVI